MRVFVAGATGILGRRVVREFVMNGYDVVGLARTSENAQWLEKQGAEPRPGDILNAHSLQKAAGGCQAFLHLATAVPTKPRTSLKDWALNDRIRREGTRNLIGAALRNDCQLYVQQSVALVYGDHGGDWVDECSPVSVNPSPVVQSAIDAEAMVRQSVVAQQLPAITLRMGSFYSHDSAQTRDLLQTAKRRIPVLGDGAMYWNLIHVDDAAAAVVAAVENHELNTGETFAVCDDEPVRLAELAEYLAQSMGGKRPLKVPMLLARLAAGSHVVDALAASVRCTNAKAKDRLAWQPRYRSFREGYRAVLEQWRTVSSSS